MARKSKLCWNLNAPPRVVLTRLKTETGLDLEQTRQALSEADQIIDEADEREKALCAALNLYEKALHDISLHSSTNRTPFGKRTFARCVQLKHDIEALQVADQDL